MLTKALLFKEQMSQLAEVFGKKPEELIKAAGLLDGIQLKLGDASLKLQF